MAPSSRSRTSQAADRALAAVGVADLPQAVLVHVMAMVQPLKQRQQAALTCKRFAAAACSPELLHEVDAGPVDSVRALHSLRDWLERHGQHVRTLRLSCHPEQDDPQAAAIAVASCLAAAGQLQQLEVFGHMAGTGWLAAVRSLRHLRLGQSPPGALRLSPDISGLSALRSLGLYGFPVSWSSHVRLPAAIMRLCLVDSGPSLPPQVTQLPQLASLSLDLCGYSPSSLSRLSSLSGSLTQLNSLHARVPPVAAISSLPRLQHLRVEASEMGGEQGERLAAALRCVTQLTCLVLHGAGLEPPAALAGLSALQRCYLLRTDQRAADEGDAQPLPPGAWLRNLRWLGAGIDTLTRSTAALQQAAALEFVEVGDTAQLQQVAWLAPGPTALCDWLAQHPPLRKASFLAGSSSGPSLAFDSRGFAARLAQLCSRRPALLVRCMDGAGDFRQSMRSAVVEPF